MHNIGWWQIPSEASLGTTSLWFIALLCKPRLENLHDVQARRKSKYIQIILTLLQYHMNFLAQAVGPKPRTNCSLCCGTSFKTKLLEFEITRRLIKLCLCNRLRRAAKLSTPLPFQSVGVDHVALCLCNWWTSTAKTWVLRSHDLQQPLFQGSGLWISWLYRLGLNASL